MSVDELLDQIDDLLDKAWSFPLTGGRCVLDAERVREIIDDIRLNMPQEVKQARLIVQDRADIIQGAKKESESIIRSAEERAKAMVAQEEIVRQAQAKANEIMQQCQVQTREMRKSARDFADNMMRKTEETLLGAVSEVKATRQSFKNPLKVSEDMMGE